MCKKNSRRRYVKYKSAWCVFWNISMILASVWLHNVSFRSSHLRCSVRKGVLRNFAELTGKHLCQSLFFNKVAPLGPATLLKKDTLAQVLCCEFCEISRNTFSAEHLQTTPSEGSKFMNKFCLTTFSFIYFKSSAGSFFLAFPVRLSLTFDIQIDLKMKHP